MRVVNHPKRGITGSSQKHELNMTLSCPHNSSPQLCFLVCPILFKMTLIMLLQPPFLMRSEIKFRMLPFLDGRWMEQLIYPAVPNSLSLFAMWIVQVKFRSALLDSLMFLRGEMLSLFLMCSMRKCRATILRISLWHRPLMGLLSWLQLSLVCRPKSKQ